MDGPCKHYVECKKPHTKEPICDSIYIKGPGKANPQRQKTDRWLQWTESDGSMAMGCPFWIMKMLQDEVEVISV